MNEPSRVAVLGAGHVGPVIARLAIRAGYPVAIATSGNPDDIALITELVITGAQPRWASDALADADIVVLEPGGPVFGVALTRPEFERAVAEDARSLT